MSHPRSILESVVNPLVSYIEAHQIDGASPGWVLEPIVVGRKVIEDHPVCPRAIYLDHTVQGHGGCFGGNELMKRYSCGSGTDNKTSRWKRKIL